MQIVKKTLLTIAAIAMMASPALAGVNIDLSTYQNQRNYVTGYPVAVFVDSSDLQLVSLNTSAFLGNINLSGSIAQGSAYNNHSQSGDDYTDVAGERVGVIDFNSSTFLFGGTSLTVYQTFLGNTDVVNLGSSSRVADDTRFTERMQGSAGGLSGLSANTLFASMKGYEAHTTNGGYTTDVGGVESFLVETNGADHGGWYSPSFYTGVNINRDYNLNNYQGPGYQVASQSLNLGIGLAVFGNAGASVDYSSMDVSSMQQVTRNGAMSTWSATTVDIIAKSLPSRLIVSHQM
ncbi:hypothetical protein ACFL08_01775 [Patescibacteria group bacterium]